MASLVQSASNTATSGTSLTVTLSPTRPGNCLVVYVGEVQGTTNPVVSGITLGGSAGNFAAAESAINNADYNAEIWVGWNCAGGQTSVVITFTAGTGTSQGNAAVVEEWSGILATSSPVDKVNGANGAGTSPSSGSTGTLTQSSELVAGAICAPFSITGPGSPWTNESQVAAGTALHLMAGYQVVSAATALTYSGTASNGWGAVIVSLKLAAPPSASYPPLIPPGLSSPMNWQRHAWPVPPPFTVSSSDAGTGSDAGSGGQLGNPGYPLIPPGFGSPMAFRSRSPHIPSSLPTFASGDTGTGADAGTVRITGADTGTGADSGGISQEADTGTGTEAGTITATVSAADAGSGADSGGIGGVKAGDTGSGAESSGSVTVRTLLMVRWSAPDKLDKSGGTMQ